jgi:hypothetical protein
VETQKRAQYTPDLVLFDLAFDQVTSFSQKAGHRALAQEMIIAASLLRLAFANKALIHCVIERFLISLSCRVHLRTSQYLPIDTALSDNFPGM